VNKRMCKKHDPPAKPPDEQISAAERHAVIAQNFRRLFGELPVLNELLRHIRSIETDR